MDTGRPTDYDPAYCSQIIEFFDQQPWREVERTNPKTGLTYTELVANKLPTLEAFAHKLGYAPSTLYRWQLDHAQFCTSYARAKSLQKDILVQNGLMRLYDSNFAKFIAINNTDLVDQKVRVNMNHDLEGLGEGLTDAELEVIARGAA